MIGEDSVDSKIRRVLVSRAAVFVVGDRVLFCTFLHLECLVVGSVSFFLVVLVGFSSSFGSSSLYTLLDSHPGFSGFDFA
ncbi:MAG: hypothetical protein WCJ17_00520, partial [bacterium]